MTNIRRATETDLPEVLDMIHALAAHHDDPVVVTLEHLLRDTLGDHPWLRVLLAPGEGYAALCPMAQLQFGVRGMDMHHLYVNEVARKCGVARALITASVDWAKSDGCRYLTVGTHPENLSAQATYRALGFEDAQAEGPRFRLKW